MFSDPPYAVIGEEAGAIPGMVLRQMNLELATLRQSQRDFLAIVRQHHPER